MSASSSMHPPKNCPHCLGNCDIFQVKKDGPNQGRYFYSCKGYATGGNCSEAKGFFEWIASAEEAPSAKRPRPAQSTSNLPRQTQHVTPEMCEQATLGSIWSTLKQIEIKIAALEQKQDFIASMVRKIQEDDEPPSSQAQ